MMADRYNGSVYIPPSYRGNALELERDAKEQYVEECKKDTAEGVCEQKKDTGGLRHPFSEDGGSSAVVLLVLFLLLLSDAGQDKKGKCPEDMLLYLGLLFLLIG